MSDNDRDSELGEESEYWRMLRDLRGGASRERPAEQPPPHRSADWYGGQQPGQQQPTQDYSWQPEPEWPQRSWERTDLWQRQQPAREQQQKQPPPPPAPYEPQPFQAQPDPYQQQQPAYPQQPSYEQRGYEQQSYDTQGYYQQPRSYEPQQPQQYEQQGYQSYGYEQQRTYEQQPAAEPEPATFEWSTQHWTDTPFESYTPPLPEVGQPSTDEDQTSQRYYEQPGGGWDGAADPASDRTEEHSFTAFQEAPFQETPFQEAPYQEEARPTPDPEPAASRHGHRVGAEPEPTWWGRIIGRLRLGPTDLEVLGLWVVTRVSLLMISSMAGLVFAGSSGSIGWLDRWRQWDVLHFERIALEGYFGHEEPEEAFFPGLPILMKLGDAIGIAPTLVGLLASFVAGGVAAVALSRLAGNEWGEAVGRRAALVWMLAPPAVFLAAPYTEALFLGFAIPAWLAATQGRWRTAGILVAGASLFRISVVFLLIALAVYFVTSQLSQDRRRQWIDGLWLLLGSVPLAGYMAYLWANTGDPLRWYHAQGNWSREFTWPHQALIGTVQAATSGISGYEPNVSANFEWMFRAELVAMLVGVVLTAMLLLLKRWGEATWVGLQVAAFSFSAWFFSVPRAALLWFPLWIAIGLLAVRHKWFWWSYALLAIPLFGVWSAAYLTGKWAG